jgi:carbamoyltransferase
LGCWPNSDEYKVMALAASGDPDRFAGSMQRALVLRDQGRFQVPLLELNRDAPSKETFSASRQWLSHSGCPGRSSDSNLLQVHLDLASAAQRRLEQALLHLVAHWVDRTGLRRVALAGGVALNCVAIGKLAASGVVDGIYVQPAAGDEGTAIGAALSAADLVVTATEYPPLTFLGPDVDEDQVPVNQPYFTAAVSEPIAEIIAARLLSQGLIVGWAQDRLEFGPRALGNRSIFADPRRREMRDRVNAAVKFREDFRPLAPAVKADCASRYFHIPPGTNMRHMTVAVPVNTHRASDITAVVHDDCTARVQEVHAAEHPRFWRILHEFERITGIGVLMNTSLNVKGQPTARSASEAYRTFDTSGLDVVFIGDRVYAKDEVVSTVRAVLAELTSQSAA